jgi:LPXTG-motif cell wall-anchored protein
MPAVLRPSHLALLLALALALPSAAFAQGAGDDQYQDPFGDEPTTAQAQDPPDEDGLSDEPPGGGSEDSGGSGSSGGGGSSGDSGSGSSGGATQTPSASAGTSGLPNTGTDPRPLAIIGVAFLLMGVGLRLRTIDPDAY